MPLSSPSPVESCKSFGSRPAVLDAWLAERYSGFAHAYWGLSGASMLYEVLLQEPRPNVVLPAFICPSISAAVQHAGKRVIHIDVDRRSMHMNETLLEACLSALPSHETVLIVDHSFGHPCGNLAEIRSRYPRLLLVEDCVRALGAETKSGAAGQVGDWTLISLYKTVPGNNHGAILLTTSPYEIRTGPPPPIRVRERVSTFAPARLIYERLKRGAPIDPPARRDIPNVSWTPVTGLPHSLCLRRFALTVSQEGTAAVEREKAALELRSALEKVPQVSVVQSSAGCRDANHFVSFTVSEGHPRNELLADLNRRGFFLLGTWDYIPANFQCFSESFPEGASESVFLSQHVVHIPTRFFTKSSRRRDLVRRIREWFSRRTEYDSIR